MRDAQDGDIGVQLIQISLDRDSQEADGRWVRTHEPEGTSGGPTVDPEAGQTGAERRKSGGSDAI